MTNLPTAKSASRIGEEVLAILGISKKLSEKTDHPALAWRRCGLLDLSGVCDGPSLMPPLAIPAVVDGAIMALKALSDNPDTLPLNGSLLLGERARHLKVERNGRSSPTGYCKLIDAADGRFAINLAREDDWGLMDAWLGSPAETLEEISQVVANKAVESLVHRGIELGLPIAIDCIPESNAWFSETCFSSTKPGRGSPLVVDLSGLWAGPLAGSLLQQMGATVIKIESKSRPDGARQGNTEFYNLLNADKKSVVLDFTNAADLASLAKLLDAADIVIEASRPRALRQLDINAEKLTAAKPGKIWLRLMAHSDDENRIGFGDDIGVAAGLCSVMEKAWDKPMFVGDAIADPVSGIFGALAAWAKWHQQQGALITLSMRDIMRFAMQLAHDPETLPTIASEWQNIATTDNAALYPMRSASGNTAELGTDTRMVLNQLC